jgi:hypothetical protein
VLENYKLGNSKECGISNDMQSPSDRFKIDFLGIGVAKAGTTWLSRCLREHPQICLSEPKELNYFCRTHIWPWGSPTFYDCGEKWLQSKFSHWRQGQLRGEFSNCYLVDPQSPLIIKKHYPEIKLIVSYRNPVEALYSLYFQAAKEYAVPRKFEDFLELYPQLIELGFYYKHTDRYLQRFPQENMFFVLFDDIRSNPEEVLRNLYAFLGLETTFRPSKLYIIVNERRAPRVKWIRDVLGNAKLFFRNNRRIEKVTKYLRIAGANKLLNWLQERNLYETKFPPMRERTRRRLQNIYCPGTINR